jgi:hypothetical protein
MIVIARYPQYFREYVWEAKHSLFGYPEDRFPQFRWIAELERRFAWLATQPGPVPATYLVRDMIQWGGSQNGCLQKFDDGIGSIRLQDMLHDVIANRSNCRDAIANAMAIPGLGLTYASKLLRFVDPVRYGALDSRLREALDLYKGKDPRLDTMPNIADRKSSAVPGYVWFCRFIELQIAELEEAHISRPDCDLPRAPNLTGWRAADIEMALFQWAASVRPRKQRA